MGDWVLGARRPNGGAWAGWGLELARLKWVRLRRLGSRRLLKKACGERVGRHALARSCEIPQVFRVISSLNPSRLVGLSAAC